MRLNIFVENPRTGDMEQDVKPALAVTGRNVDERIKAARKLLKDRGYPPVRSIHVGEKDTLVVYCGSTRSRETQSEHLKGLKFSKPSMHKA